MRRVVVTGASGFVARHLIPRLLANEWSVVGVARRPVPPPWLDGIEWIDADLANWDSTCALLDRAAPQALIHLAGQVHGSYGELCAANVTSVSNLLHAARGRSPALRIVLFGSAAEYGAVPEVALPITEQSRCEPMGAYGGTKLAATTLALAAARDWGSRVSIVRPFNIVGAHVPPAFVAGALIKRIHDALQARDSQAITVGRTDTTRDFVDAGDLSSAVVRLLDLDAAGEVFNLCSGRETSIRELLDTLIAMAGEGISWRQDPALIRPGDVLRSFGDCGKARAQLRFAPVTRVEDSLRAAWHARVTEPA
jgi:GDP-4-dehydro-6-deoxy-D-mannose reductase